MYTYCPEVSLGCAMASMASSSSTTDGATTTAFQQGHSAKIFVGNLPFKTTRTDLAELFCRFGGIVGVNIRKDRRTDKSRGYAFVTFATDAAAVAAIAEMHGKSLEGRVLTVKSALARGQQGAAVASAAEEEADNSGWATAPPRRRHGGGNKRNGRRSGRGGHYRGGQDRGHETDTRPKQKSWTEWTSFPDEQNNGSRATAAVPVVAPAETAVAQSSVIAPATARAEAEPQSHQ